MSKESTGSEVQRYLDISGETKAGQALFDMVESQFEQLSALFCCTIFDYEFVPNLLEFIKIKKTDSIDALRVKVATALADLDAYGMEGFDEFIQKSFGDSENLEELEDGFLGDIRSILSGLMTLLVDGVKTTSLEPMPKDADDYEVDDYRHYASTRAMEAAGVTDFDLNGYFDLKS